MTNLQQPLDDSTLGRVAEVICGTDDGPVYRAGWRIRKFLVQAGWPNVPEFGDSSRKTWTLQRLLERKHDESAVEQVLRRLCDPREYDSHEDAHAAAHRLNQILSVEGRQISYVNARPIVQETTPTMDSPAGHAPLELRADISEIVRDEQMVALLRSRLNEAETCREYGAHVAGLIILGSVLEGVLYSMVERNKSQAFRCASATGDGKQPPSDLRSWRLDRLIDIAHKCGWIQLDAKRFSHSLREYRNIVHPRQQIADGHAPDRDTLIVCWNVVMAVINDLADRATDE